MLCTIALGLALHATSGAAKVAPISLADLSLFGDAIVIGRVSRLVCVGPEGLLPCTVRGNGSPEARRGLCIVAEVEVERVIKGDPSAERLWYLAQGTWTCDVSTAVLGERALLFLNQSDPLREAGTEVRRAAQELTDGQPVLQDAWSGRGRLPIRREQGEESVTAWHDVIPPDELHTEPAEHEKYPNIYWSAQLADVVRLVETSLEARPLVMPAHPVSGLPAAAAVVADGERVVVALWRDGTIVWSGHPEAGGPPYRQGRATESGLERLHEWCETFDTGADLRERAAPSFQLRTRMTTGLIAEFGEPGAASAARLGNKPGCALRRLLLRCIPEEGNVLDFDSPVMR